MTNVTRTLIISATICAVAKNLVFIPIFVIGVLLGALFTPLTIGYFATVATAAALGMVAWDAVAIYRDARKFATPRLTFRK